MSAPLVAISPDAPSVTPSAHHRLARRAKPNLRVVPDVQDRAPAPPAVASIGARPLDETSRAWLDALRSHHLRREEAIASLHALLVREARFEVRRRTRSLTHPSGRDLDDLAVQAANDAVVSILAKLDHFRGESLFTTWARRFVQREAADKIRRRLGRGRELPIADGFEHARLWAVDAEPPYERCVANELARTLARGMAEDLTPREREVLFALAVNGEPTKRLARRLNTTTGALHKTLHVARSKLKASLAAA
jgi:RNA polymerase sigma-70 factor, ECF subfamily